MMRSLIGTWVLVVIGFAASINQNYTGRQDVVLQTPNQIEHEMKNLISIVEIPTADFSKAVTFYQTILEVSIEKVQMEGIQMGVLPSNGETVNVVLVHGEDYKPTRDGTLIYFNAGDNLQNMLDKIAASGGEIILPKTEISPEMGFFALFIDTEGNKVGLHGMN